MTESYARARLRRAARARDAHLIGRSEKTKPGQTTQQEAFRGLAGGVVIQALRDCLSRDVLTAADAASWLLQDGGFYLEVCGLGHLEPGECLRTILEIEGGDTDD